MLALVLALMQPMPVPGPPVVKWYGNPGDANGVAGARAPEWILFEPLRLGLLSQAPATGRSHPACADNNELLGASTGQSSFASQHVIGTRLTPSLTLFGFTRGGCALDAGIGGAIVHATPLRPNIWLTTSAGFLFLPQYNPNGTPAMRTQLRTDVIFKQNDGRSVNVGVGMHGVSVGGVL